MVEHSRYRVDDRTDWPAGRPYAGQAIVWQWLDIPYRPRWIYRGAYPTVEAARRAIANRVERYA